MTVKKTPYHISDGNMIVRRDGLLSVSISSMVAGDVELNGLYVETEQGGWFCEYMDRVARDEMLKVLQDEILANSDPFHGMSINNEDVGGHAPRRGNGDEA